MSETRYIAKPKLKSILAEFGSKMKYPSQKDFALAVGVKEPTISRFDHQSRYDINTLVSMSKVLEIPIEDLFDIEENPNYIDQGKEVKPDLLDLLQHLTDEQLPSDIKELNKEDIMEIIEKSLDDLDYMI